MKKLIFLILTLSGCSTSHWCNIETHGDGELYLNDRGGFVTLYRFPDKYHAEGCYTIERRTDSPDGTIIIFRRVYSQEMIPCIPLMQFNIPDNCEPCKQGEPK